MPAERVNVDFPRAAIKMAPAGANEEYPVPGCLLDVTPL